MVSSKGADIHVVPPLIARLTRQVDNTQQFIGGDDSLALTTQQVSVSATNTETNYYRKTLQQQGQLCTVTLKAILIYLVQFLGDSLKMRPLLNLNLSTLTIKEATVSGPLKSYPHTSI